MFGRQSHEDICMKALIKQSVPSNQKRLGWVQIILGLLMLALTIIFAPDGMPTFLISFVWIYIFYWGINLLKDSKQFRLSDSEIESHFEHAEDKPIP